MGAHVGLGILEADGCTWKLGRDWMPVSEM
jgi:hypothetical protein